MPVGRVLTSQTRRSTRFTADRLQRQPVALYSALPRPAVSHPTSTPRSRQRCQCGCPTPAHWWGERSAAIRSRNGTANGGAAPRPCSATGDTTPTPTAANCAPGPAGGLPQRRPEHPGPEQAPLRRRAAPRPAPPVQTPRRSLERRTEFHGAFSSLACSLIYWRRLKKRNS